MPRMLALILAVALLALAASAPAQDDDAGFITPVPPSVVGWNDVDERERTLVGHLLDDDDWPFRAIGLLRLERYTGVEVDDRIGAALRDEAWQVRCFAIRQAVRLGVPIHAQTFRDETNPYVVRSLLRAGVELPDDQLDAMVEPMTRSGDPEERVLAFEIASRCEAAHARERAGLSLLHFINDMDQASGTAFSDRIAYLLGLWPLPSTLGEWRAWHREVRREFELPRNGDAIDVIKSDPRPIVAALEREALSRLWEYLDILRQDDLDVAIVMDISGSMQSVIDQIRAEVTHLVMFLEGVSKNFRIAVVGYRDAADNVPVQREKFTDKVRRVRTFLSRLRASGGGDEPESILLGLESTAKLSWTEGSRQMAILIGDAPAHRDDHFKIQAMLQEWADAGRITHTLYVGGMQPVEDIALEFEDMARWGEGSTAVLTERQQLVTSVLKTTIAESWWPYLEEFWNVYRAWCR